VREGAAEENGVEHAWALQIAHEPPAAGKQLGILPSQHATAHPSGHW
jgi:hypothetical protein